MRKRDEPKRWKREGKSRRGGRERERKRRGGREREEEASSESSGSLTCLRNLALLRFSALLHYVHFVHCTMYYFPAPSAMATADDLFIFVKLSPSTVTPGALHSVQYTPSDA